MRTFRPTLRTMLLLAFMIVTITPVAVMTVWLNLNIQRGVMKEAHDKNQLLSENLASPVYLYLKAAERNLRLLADLQDKSRDQAAINETIASQAYFSNIVLVAPDGSAHGYEGRGINPEYLHFIQTSAIIQSLRSRHVSGNSGMIPDPLTKKPALFFFATCR